MMTTPTPIRFEGELACIDFTRFDLETYRFFLQVKSLPETRVSFTWETDTYTVTTPARFASRLGAELPDTIRQPIALSDHLFDYQRWAVNLALEAKRYALWLNTGLGKTACYLEWARQVVTMTGGRVLILAPLAVIPQTVRMARDFYGDGIAIDQLHSRDELMTWCANGGAHDIAMCNYEKLIPGDIPEFRLLAGLVCDESSMLKTGGGKIKWNLIHSAKGIEYKLSCTATPAPNDVMEYASQASFLETMRSEGEVFWTFFSRNKAGEWSVKPHARAAFYRFLSSWSLYLHDPAHFGFADILASLPDPVLHEERIGLSAHQREPMVGILAKHGGDMFGDKIGVVPRSKLAQLARGFLYGEPKGSAQRYWSGKPQRVAEIIEEEVARGNQVIVWTTFDEEAPIIREHLACLPIDIDTVAELNGRMSETKRLEMLDRFRAGEIRALISKPQLIGYGLNLQFVRAMVFSGFDDSFERSYQAVRRAYRFGQTEPVHVYWPYIPELEGAMFSNIREKEARFMAEVEAQETAYREAFAATGDLAIRDEVAA